MNYIRREKRRKTQSYMKKLLRKIEWLSFSLACTLLPVNENLHRCQRGAGIA
jgi:hypothetical protein